MTYIDIPYPQGVEPTQGGGVALSPDGRTVAMVAVRDGSRRVFIRRLDRPEAFEIPDSAGISWMTFSPDGQSIAFVPADGAIVRISLVDQQRKVLASGVDVGVSGTWIPGGVVFNRDGALWIVPAAGGEPRELTRLDAARREIVHGDAAMLPDGRTLLFSSRTSEAGTERIEAVSVESKQRSVVVERATTPVWSPTGHLLFERDGAVLAAPADASTGAIRGPALSVIPSGVVGRQLSGALAYWVSAAGTLLYAPKDSFTRRVVSVHRDGTAIALDFPAGQYFNPRLSPDGRQLLVGVGGFAIDALDLTRGTRATIAPPAPGTSFPTWTADSTRVVLRRLNLPMWVAADGTAREGIPPGGMTNDFPSATGPDADSVFMLRIRPQTGGDIYLLSLSGTFRASSPDRDQSLPKAGRSFAGWPLAALSVERRRESPRFTCGGILTSARPGRSQLAAASRLAGTVRTKSVTGAVRG